MQALTRPEADLQRQVAEAIAKAHQLGMPRLEDTAGPLMEALSEPDQHPVVRLAMARALRIADGPDEVHRGMVARLELKKYA